MNFKLKQIYLLSIKLIYRNQQKQKIPPIRKDLHLSYAKIYIPSPSKRFPNPPKIPPSSFLPPGLP
jgi:hypothetical protein